VKIGQAPPITEEFLSFNLNGEKIGTLDYTDGKLEFTGKVAESAKMFFDYVQTLSATHLDMKIQERADKVPQEIDDKPA